jgi:hypothetical protein
LEALVEAVQDVQQKSAVTNGFVEVIKGINHVLHLAAIVVDGESALGKGVKLGIEEHGSKLTIVQELLFDPEPGRPSSDVVTLVDDV